MGLAVAFTPGWAHAQGVVTGQVTVAETGEPLPSATVLVRGTERGALTGSDGRFTIEGVPAGERVVEASGLGYRGSVETVPVVEGAPVEVDFELVSRPLEVGGISVNVLRPDLQPRGELTEREVRRANPQDAGQVLRSLDGVDAARRGPLGLDPVVRGLRETEVGTYLDGTRLFPAGPARMDSPLTHLDPSAVQNIEVVKGPYALTWGAGNLGAIRVETAPLPPAYDRTPSGTASFGYDTNLAAAEISGTGSGRSGPVSFWTHGAWRQGGDYRTGGADTIPGDFRSSEIRGKLGYDVAENTLLSVTGGYQDQGPLDYPGRLLTARFFYSSNLAAEWLTERQDGLLRRWELSAYRNAVSHGMDNSGKPTRMVMQGRTPPFSLDIDVDSDLEVWGGRAAADLVTGPWALRLGGDVYSANRHAVRTIARRADDFPGGPEPGTVLFDNLLWPDATITDVGAYARASRTLDSGVQLAGTVRLDRVRATADTAGPEFLEYLGNTGQSQELEADETNLSVAATAGFPINSTWNLSVGFGSAVRTADASERYSDHLQSTKAQTAAEFMGKPDLDPERSNQVDLWLEGNYPRTALQLNLFGRRIMNYITIARAPDEVTRLPLPIFPEEVYRYENGEATFFGGEASVMYGLTDVLTADVGLSYLWGEETVYPDLDDPDVEVTEPAFGVSPLRSRLGLRYEELGGRYFLEGTASLVTEQDRVATTRGESATEGHATVDLRAGWAPIQGVNVRFGVQNLFDEEYVNHLNSRNPYSGVPLAEPGRVFFVDLTYGF